jgi:DNA helicase TIP49 (TBP-interacting protein)
MLLREHDVGRHDDAPIAAGHVARTCKTDWGLWKTVTTNLGKVHRLADRYDVLTAEDIDIIRARLDSLVEAIDEHPATLRWRLRGRIGERLKWYRDVDEVK